MTGAARLRALLRRLADLGSELRLQLRLLLKRLLSSALLFRRIRWLLFWWLVLSFNSDLRFGTGSPEHPDLIPSAAVPSTDSDTYTDSLT